MCRHRCRYVNMHGRRDATGAPDRLRALLCARQSCSLAAQLVALDAGYCAPSTGCTVPLMFLPTSPLVPERRGPSVIMQSTQRRPNGGGLAPVDSEDGVVVAARCTTSLASWPPTVPRRAWQFANWVSQLLTSDATRRGIWAWHTTSNVTSATRIAARLLHRTVYQSAAAMANSWSCSEGQMRSLTSVSACG